MKSVFLIYSLILESILKTHYSQWKSKSKKAVVSKRYTDRKIESPFLPLENRVTFSFSDILLHKYLYSDFREYLTDAMAEESLDFFLSTYHFQKKFSWILVNSTYRKDSLKEEAENICRKFLGYESELIVPLSEEKVKKILNDLENNEIEINFL